MSKPAFDAVTLEILWRRMISAADEAAKALQRVSFSALVNESNDFACVLTDATGASLVQNTESIPSFNGCLPVTVKHFLEAIGVEAMAPGDFLVCNDPWVGTGHLNDVTVAKPVFRDGRLVAFCASTAHAPDIGGKVRSVVAREVFEEGFAIPAMHLIRGGEPDATFFRLLRAAVRTPDQTEGDIWAQATALDLMEERLNDLMDEYGLDDLQSFADEIHGRCESAMRAAIADASDGRYEYGFETDGLAEPFRFQVAVEIAGDRVSVDWSGTSGQVGRAINCPFVYTFAMTSYALKCAFLPNLPNNEGVFRCIEVSAPEGSLVNPVRPASVGGRMATGHYLPMAIFGALAQAMPEKAMAASGSPLWSIIQTGVYDDGRPYANTLFFNGGSGATAETDGQSCYSWPSNISDVPVELTERNTPFFVARKALPEGSGGAGAQRGGDGQEIVLEHRGTREIGVIFMAERLRHPAMGLLGGGAGAKGAVLIDGAPADARADHVLRPGQAITLQLPGGGGYGAGAANDGCDGVDCPLSNCANIPIEALEMDYPFARLEAYRLRQGSGGGGRHRGGDGLERCYRILDDGVQFATYSDRFKTQAQGLFGGDPGASAEFVVERGDETIRVPSKARVVLERDDLLVVRTGGGGGYGTA